MEPALQLGMGFILLMRPISKMAPTAPSCSHTHHLLLSDAYLLVLFWKKKRQPDISGSTEEVDRQPEEKWSWAGILSGSGGPSPKPPGHTQWRAPSPLQQVDLLIWGSALRVVCVGVQQSWQVRNGWLMCWAPGGGGLWPGRKSQKLPEPWARRETLSCICSLCFWAFLQVSSFRAWYC